MDLTIEAIRAIKANAEVLNLITGSNFVNARYKPRSSKRSPSKMAFSRFWSSEEGAAFRLVCENLFKEAAPGLLRGRTAKIKSAVYTIIIEYRAEKGLDAK